MFRGSFVFIAKPKLRDEKKSYEVTGLFDDKTTSLKLLRDLAQATAVAEWGADNVPKKLVLPFHDSADLEGEYDGFESGQHYCRFWNKRLPTESIYDEEGEHVYEEGLDEFYSGAFYRAVVRPYAWSNSGKKGVSFDLLGLKKVKDGERLGASDPKVDASDFE